MGPVASNAPRCGVCETKLVKNGRTSAGKTRWRCRTCGASTVQRRTDITRRAEFEAFLARLQGRATPLTQALSPRTLRRRTAWCWDVQVPQPVVTGEIYLQVIVDGTYFQGWCLLVAHNGEHVVAWQWCDRESKAAWSALLQRLPAPQVVVTDGGTGLRAALDEKWPKVKIQRCYFHIFAAVRRHTTYRPRLQAGKEILALTRELMAVRDLDEAATWMGAYATWETRWANLLKERTYAKATTDRPAWVKPSQQWWYTHIRLRRVQGLYRLLIRDKSLFTWLQEPFHHPGTRQVDRTTSRLEGGVNAGIKELLRRHRGMTQDHARRAVEWYLNTLTEFPHDPWNLASTHLAHTTSQPAPEPEPDPLGPRQYDTGLTAEEGLWIRKGWAGRSN